MLEKRQDKARRDALLVLVQSCCPIDNPQYAIHRVNVRYTEMLAGKEKGNITVAGKAVRFGRDVYGQSKA